MRYLLAGLSTRGLAESAVRAGKECCAVDFFGDLDLEQICHSISLRREYRASLNLDPFLFLRAAETLEYDCLVYTGPLENYPQILQKFAERCEIIGNDAETVRKVRNWKILYRFCKENKILIPRTANGLDFVVKPKKSGGGIGIRRLPHYIVQEFVKGEAFSASVIGNGTEAEVISVNEQLIGKKEFGGRRFWYCGNITPAYTGKEEEIRNTCENLVKAFRLKGSSGIDFVVNQGVYLMEVNPRPQATLEIVEKAFDINLFLMHEQGCRGESTQRKNPQKTWGKAILYAEEDLRMPDTSEWLNYGWIKDIPHPFDPILKSEPICTVLADGSDRDDCFEYLVVRAESVRELTRKQNRSIC